ncbi:hypothetical protein PDR5_32160 [Pseudomonas sp. DR 5-09]|nr:hypothetical protein PDR5_32160 [Pseudomonas sp. DR 5-09]
MPFGKVAGIRDETGNASACLESSPPDHPARLKVRICDEAGLLADGVRALARYSLRLPAGSGWSWQWRGSEQHRSQLRGQPRLGPRSLLSFDVGRRTSKAQGYAWVRDGSMGGWFWEHIRCCGYGHLGFRPYGGSLFPNAEKVTKKAEPRRTALRLGSVFPRYGVHQGASPTVCFAAPPLDVCGFAARRCAPTP